MISCLVYARGTGKGKITETYMTGLRVMKMIAGKLSFVVATIINRKVAG